MRRDQVFPIRWAALRISFWPVEKLPQYLACLAGLTLATSMTFAGAPRIVDNLTNDRKLIAHAAIMDARQKISSFAAKLTYERDIDNGTDRPDKQTLVGECLWSHRVVKYELAKANSPTNIQIAVFRNDDMTLKLELSEVPERGERGGHYSFSFEQPIPDAIRTFKRAGSLMSFADRRLALGEDSVDGLWSQNDQAIAVESTETNLFIEIKRRFAKRNGEVIYRFSKSHSFLPVSVSLQHEIEGRTEPLSSHSFEWQAVNGVFVPKSRSYVSHFRCKDGKKRPLQIRVDFLQPRVNSAGDVQALVPESLSIPNGTLGADLRSNPSKLLIFVNKQFLPRSTDVMKMAGFAEHRRKLEASQSHSEEVNSELAIAESGRVVRRRYYLRVALISIAVGVIVAATFALVARMRKR